MSHHNNEGNPPQLGPPAHVGGTTKEDWILQQLNRVERETATLTTIVQSQSDQISELAENTKEMSKRLHKVQLILASAAGATLIIGFIVNKKFDAILEALSKVAG